MGDRETKTEKSIPALLGANLMHSAETARLSEAAQAAPHPQSPTSELLLTSSHLRRPFIPLESLVNPVMKSQSPSVLGKDKASNTSLPWIVILSKALNKPLAFRIRLSKFFQLRL